MSDIEEHVSLKHYNTFGIDARARYFTSITSLEQLKDVINTDVYRQNPCLILGGGSNVLLTKDFDGLVMHSAIKGIRVTRETNDHVWVEVGSGESWHPFVLHALQQNWGGIENLSLIPGTMGAAPMQNIGAYGVEIKEVVDTVSALDLQAVEERIFSAADCQFGYRESIFKRPFGKFFFISSVTLRLTKKNHVLRTSYGAIQEVLKQQNITQPTIHDVSNAVIAIRESKLPDPRVIGNAGSFFKNPTLSKKSFERLQLHHPEIPFYPADNQEIKIPAGWLIERCGWKGKKIRNVGVHHQQALVLVNFGNAKGEEIFHLATQIQASVKEKFDVDLVTEVNVI